MIILLSIVSFKRIHHPRRPCDSAMRCDPCKVPTPRTDECNIMIIITLQQRDFGLNNNIMTKHIICEFFCFALPLRCCTRNRSRTQSSLKHTMPSFDLFFTYSGVTTKWHDGLEATGHGPNNTEGRVLIM